MPPHPTVRRTRRRGAASLPSVVLKRGTLLYRAGPDVCTWNRQFKKRKADGDTGKTGVYLATYPLQSLGMLLEYEQDMHVGVFCLTRDVRLPAGKYAFRDLHPELYTDARGAFVPNVPLPPDANINHVEWNHSTTFATNGLGPLDAEVFLADPSDVAAVRLLRVHAVTRKRLGPLLERYNHTPHAPYLDAFPVVPDCASQSRAGSTRDAADYTRREMEVFRAFCARVR